MKDILKKTLQKKEKAQQAYLEAMNMDSEKEADKLRDNLLNLEKHVKTLTAGIKATNAATTKISNASGLKISKRDPPKFQLEDRKVKPFPKEASYKLVDHFLNEFEKIVFSSSQDTNDIWKKYISLTLHPTYVCCTR